MTRSTIRLDRRTERFDGGFLGRLFAECRLVRGTVRRGVSRGTVILGDSFRRSADASDGARHRASVERFDDAGERELGERLFHLRRDERVGAFAKIRRRARLRLRQTTREGPAAIVVHERRHERAEFRHERREKVQSERRVVVAEITESNA